MLKLGHLKKGWIKGVGVGCKANKNQNTVHGHGEGKPRGNREQHFTCEFFSFCFILVCGYLSFSMNNCKKHTLQIVLGIAMPMVKHMEILKSVAIPAILLSSCTIQNHHFKWKKIEFLR